MTNINYIDPPLKGSNDLNIYTAFNKSTSVNSGFILRYFQTIPKYYFLDSSFRTLICNYGLGSGKTSAAIYIATHYLDQINKAKFINKHIVPNKILVLGSWVTIDAFKRDILKPEFHFVTYEEQDEINNKLNSPFKEIREEGKQQQKQLEKRIFSNFIMKNFQTIFNMAFPDIDEQKYFQHVESLISALNRGELKISQEFLNSLRNTLIVVDECQGLWSQQGMNTYGFIIGLLIKKAEEYNIRFVFLSGTIINNNISELANIYSIMNPDKFINVDDYQEDRNILNTTLKTLKKDKVDEILNFFSDKFLYYSNNSANAADTKLDKISLNLSDTTEINPTTGLKFKLDKIPTITSNEKLYRLTVKPINKALPITWHLGNTVVKSESNDMVIYSIPVRGYHKQKYDEYLEGLDKNTDDNLDEANELKVSLHDGAFNSNDESIYYSGGVYTGKGLEYPNICNYSAIGGEMVRICLYNTLRGEKVICYHDKINNFGLKQYIEILKVNGYIEYGTSVKENTRCQKCGLKLSDHGNNHMFTPMCYAVLLGEVSESDRHKLTDIYNSPNNVTGEIISVMMISKVAYAGVSFYNTTNMIILSKISNMSIWKQICGRIVRTSSHALLPESMRIAKIYTMVVHSDNENVNNILKGGYNFENVNFENINENPYRVKFDKSEDKDFENKNENENPYRVNFNTIINNINTDIFKKSPISGGEFNFNVVKYTHELKYYAIRNILNDEVNDITYKLYKSSVTDKLFNGELQIQHQTIKNIFMRDVEKEISIVVRRMNLKDRYPWSKDGFISRIKSDKNILSYIDYSKFDDTYIQDLLTNKNYIRIFRFKNLDTYFYLPSQKEKIKEYVEYHSFKFTDLCTIKIESKNIKSGIEKLINLVAEGDAITIRNHLSKLLKLLNNNPEQLINYPIFWDAIYAIHDEYYDDDATNFTKNHSTQGRSSKTFTGCYIGQYIYLKNGERIKLNHKGSTLEEWEGIPFKFKISSSSLTGGDSSIWYLRPVILEENGNHNDKRKQNTGVNCMTFDTHKLIKFLPKINFDETKKQICINLISILCDYALEHKVKLANMF